MEPVPFTYLALGDSYTVGEGIPGERSFPYQLQRSINHWKDDERTINELDEAAAAESISLAGNEDRFREHLRIAEPLIIAKTGWTTSELLAGIQDAKLTGRFDLVTLLIGVNNQYRGESPEQYREEFRHLLELAISFAQNDSSAVFVLSVPDWSATPFADQLDRGPISTAIDHFNDINREIASRYMTHYIDVTADSRKAAGDPTQVASDELHPSEIAYSQWIYKLAPIVYQQLRIMKTRKLNREQE